ncbi:TetR/AcrR family transcriptional regulator [Nocardia fluminea]|uniref:TetR family transcriptional regulator n=1 Tax=Nocardia fluminea TaxID=134984 RepID=A0A2N3V4M4_9NOCA|nr:TetR/AcrR family transcriptional regulator [Nocardia fluminea]PKV76575.1 TetR family transcriptional regulator [Nocardia fluminea]
MGTVLWERMARTAGAPGKALSPALIAATAVTVADVDGLDAITMRRLATELGVTPMAAYRHVSNKDEVLALMVDLVFGEIDLPAGTEWRSTLWAMAQEVRALILRHPWLTRLSAPQMIYELTPNRLALTERALTALHIGLGLDLDTAMAVCRTISAYVQGATSAEIGLGELMNENGWSTGADARAGLSSQMRWLLATDRFPTFARYIHEAARKDDLRWQFDTGLTQVLHGIAIDAGDIGTAGPPGQA